MTTNGKHLNLWVFQQFIKNVDKNIGTDPSNIRKSQQIRDNKTDAPQWSKSVLRSALSQSFDFKTHCFFCSEVLNVKQESFRVIFTISLKTSITEQARERNDDWGRAVYKRKCTEIDLVAAEARYHVSCYWRFKKPPSNQKPWRPKMISCRRHSKTFV